MCLKHFPKNPKKWLILRKLFVEFLFIPPKFLLLLSIWNNIKEAKQKLQIHRYVVQNIADYYCGLKIVCEIKPYKFKLMKESVNI